MMVEDLFQNINRVLALIWQLEGNVHTFTTNEEGGQQMQIFSSKINLLTGKPQYISMTWISHQRSR